MSGTLTLAAGQVFTGGTSLSDGDTGAIALTEVGTVSFDTAASPPTISDVDITQDAAAHHRRPSARRHSAVWLHPSTERSGHHARRDGRDERRHV